MRHISHNSQEWMDRDVRIHLANEAIYHGGKTEGEIIRSIIKDKAENSSCAVSRSGVSLTPKEHMAITKRVEEFIPILNL